MLRVLHTESIVLLVSLAVLLAVPATAAELAAPESPAALEFDRDGDGAVGEATAIRARIQEYRERHGIDGQLTPAQMLERTRFGYQRWQEEQAKAYGIEGNGWISLGPNNGAGRTPSIVPHPTDEGTLLAGAAGGGVWRTIDSGATWVPLTDGFTDLSVGAVAYAPENTDVIYVGTGEGGYASDMIPGIGLLRSLDGGATWDFPQGPDDVLATQFFALNVYHPDGTNVSDVGTYEVFAATDNGLFKSVDGGTTWEVSIPASGLFGVTEILRPDPASNPELMYAALWCSGSCPSGFGRVMKSTDSGVSWLPAEIGLPGVVGDWSRNRNSLTSTAEGQTLYLGLNTASDVSGVPEARIYRSDDGGESWSQTANTGTYLGQQGWYDNTITVHPTDPNIVIGGGVWYVTSANGGASWAQRNPYQGAPNLPHVDAHDLQWQGDTLWIGCDGGVWSSTDNGVTWTDRNNTMVTRQYYAMAIDPINQERVLGGTQDNGTNMRRDVGDGSWDPVWGGDGAECAINPINPDTIFVTSQYGRLYRVSLDPDFPYYWDVAPDAEASAAFVTPFTMRPEAPGTVYTGTVDVWRSDMEGDGWTALSTEVENGYWATSVVRAIATTPADPELLMISKGSVLFTSHNSGESWRQFVGGPSINNIDISPLDANYALICTAGSSTGISGIFRTTDGGFSWSLSGYGLPPNFAVQVVRWDPTDPMVAYAGTDIGIYRSMDGGINWAYLGNGLPAASIHDMRILPDGSMLKVATHGRGMWALDITDSGNSQPTVEISSHMAVSATAGDTVEMVASVSDADGDDVAITWMLTDTWQTIDGGSGSGTFDSTTSITIDRGGSYDIVARATDSHGAVGLDRVVATVAEPADDCATPIVIPGDGPFPTTVITGNSTATIGADDPNVLCVNDPSDPDLGNRASIWFEFTPAESNTYVINTCGSRADTILSLYTGEACGPYTWVPGACQDDDERVHCNGQRSDTYLELDLEAGTTYRILGTGFDYLRGRFVVNVDCETCTTTIEERQYIVAAAAHNDGANDTTWVTDLNLYNPGANDVSAEIAFLPSQTDNSEVEGIDVSLAAGTAVEYQDVVSSLLGGTGSGAIRIITSEELLIASRTYNDSELGTFGQFIPGVSDQAAVAAGASTRLIGLAGNQSFRTNIGLANASELAASVTINFFDADSTSLFSLEQTLAPYSWVQLNEVFADQNLEDISSATAVISNTSAAATVFAYASIIDALTGDPVYVSEAVEGTPLAPLWIAAAAHVDGVGASVWRTDLELANTSSVAVQAEIALFRKDQANPDPEVVTTLLQSGESVAIGDVVFESFGLTDSGALRITIDAGTLVATSRTYNLTDQGTYGQFIPAVTAAAAAGEGDSAVLTQLRHDTSSFRTNVGVLNLGGTQITVDAAFYGTDGELLGSEVYTLEPYELSQDNGAVPGAGTNGGIAVLSSTTPGASFLAYASVIDRGSDDPVFIPATVLAD